MKSNIVKGKQRREVEAYEKRRDGIVNLWRWRRGEIEAYVVNTYDMKDYWDDYDGDICEGVEKELIFGYDNAKQKFEECKCSHEPSFNGYYTDCYSVTEIVSIGEEEVNRLEITTANDLIELITYYFNIEEKFAYAPSIIDKDVVVTWKSRGNNRYSNVPVVENVEERRVTSYHDYFGNYRPAQESTANLANNQDAFTIEELRRELPQEAYDFGYFEGFTKDEIFKQYGAIVKTNEDEDE